MKDKKAWRFLIWSWKEICLILASWAIIVAFLSVVKFNVEQFKSENNIKIGFTRYLFEKQGYTDIGAIVLAENSVCPTETTQNKSIIDNRTIFAKANGAVDFEDAVLKIESGGRSEIKFVLFWLFRIGLCPVFKN
ncbi:MAG: hypothetical protein WCJ33_09035 [Pseudomonadota bacterium]